MAANISQESIQDQEDLNTVFESKETVLNRVGSATSRASGADTTCRVVLLSSKIRQSSTLTSSARKGVEIIPYKYDTTTLESLLLQTQKILGDKKADSVAIIASGQPGSLQLVANTDNDKVSNNLQCIQPKHYKNIHLIEH